LFAADEPIGSKLCNGYIRLRVLLQVIYAHGRVLWGMVRRDSQRKT
jgi:hypothetical protein